MGMSAHNYGFQTFGYHTEDSGTAIEEAILPKGSGRLAITHLAYTGSGTAHTLSLMYADGTGSRNTADGEQASGQKDIVCVDDPKDPAGNAAAADDIVIYQLKDGSWEKNTVASVSSKTITLSNNISAPGIADGAKVNILGVQGDGAEFQLLGASSSQQVFENGGDPVIAAPYEEEPLYFYSPNGTNAGSLDNMVVAAINK